MNEDLRILLILAAAFLALFGAAELLYHKAGVRAEYTRKIVHAGTGLLTLLFPLFLDHFWQVALLCGSFLAILLASMRWKLLSSINAVERDTLGSILYPVIVAAVFLFYQYARNEFDYFGSLTFFYLPILIMAICDPLAAVVGQHIASRLPKLRGRKTWQGSAAFFAGALVLAAIFTNDGILDGTENYYASRGMALAIALSTTFAERWSKRGWDNFTIPATTVAVLWVFELVRV